MILDRIQLIILVRVMLAAIAGVIVGYDRERSNKAAGIRTQMLVCVASALLAGISIYLGEWYGHPTADPARLMAQVVSGIGFLGAGVILKNGGNKVIGVTTAATIWTSAAIGVAIGAGFYYPAILTTILVLLLNPLAIFQYKYGLKGDGYALEAKKKDRDRLMKVLKELKIRVRDEQVGSSKMVLKLVSSGLKNDQLLGILTRKKVNIRLRREEIE